MSKCSILISSYKRLEYLKRTLHYIAANTFKYPHEVVIAEEISEDTPKLIEELHKFDNKFNWTVVTISFEDFERKTGIKKYFNNPSLTNNLAFHNSTGDLIFLQGNDVIGTIGSYNQLIEEYEKANNLHTLVYSSTYDFPHNSLPEIGEYGEQLDNRWINLARNWPLQNKNIRSMVTNYLSICHRKSWEELNGYDYNYLKGVAAEDSSFSLRFRKLPGGLHIYSETISLHQNHNGRTMYQDIDQNIMQSSRLNQGVSINRAYFAEEQNIIKNRFFLPDGEFGVKDIYKNTL